MEKFIAYKGLKPVCNHVKYTHNKISGGLLIDRLSLSDKEIYDLTLVDIGEVEKSFEKSLCYHLEVDVSPIPYIESINYIILDDFMDQIYLHLNGLFNDDKIFVLHRNRFACFNPVIYTLPSIRTKILTYALKR